LSPAEIQDYQPEIEAQLACLRVDIRAQYPEGLRAASILEATWLMGRLEALSLPARRYLAHHVTWI
jgi:hypothetical protein